MRKLFELPVVWRADHPTYAWHEPKRVADVLVHRAEVLGAAP